MDRVQENIGAAELGIDAIDRIGVSAIAKALGISKQAVRKWRRRGSIPDDRHDDIRRLLESLPEQVSAVAWVAEVSDVVKMVPPENEGATGLSTERGIEGEPQQQALAVMPAARPRLEQIAGKHAQRSMSLLIAARDVDQARLVVDRAATDAAGLPPRYPVRAYRTRLAILFALDFPILTMAFVAVIQVSPIIAAGSAIALSLGLVLAAHAAGARLRDLARHLPLWVRDLAALATMLLLIAAVIGVATDLRLKGFELDGQLLADAQAGLFDEQPDVLSNLPEPFVWAIVRTAGLVTVLLTVFGLSWSYRQHGPQSVLARAEADYRKALRRYASALARSKVTSVLAPISAVVVAMLSGQPAHAADCDGPSVLALIDTTTVYDDEDREQIMPAIDEMVRSLAPGSQLVIRTLRDAPSSSRLLLDSCVPAAVIFAWSLDGIWTWLTSHPSASRKAQADFRTAIRDALLPQLRQHGDAPATALIGTIAHVTAEIDRLRSVWLFSDLLESVAVPTEILLSRSDGLIQSGGSAPALAGVDVHVAGIGRFHDRHRRPLTSRERGFLNGSWTAFVRNAGGELHVAN